jgi:DNA-binding response OmpR family regulator
MGAILIVEDEPILALEIQEIVAGAGYTVSGPYRTVAKARMCLEHEPIDGALLDVNLEGGELVYPLADALAARGTPFIFATGNGRWVERRFAHVPVVHKPYRPSEILGALRRVLHWSSTLRPSPPATPPRE